VGIYDATKLMGETLMLAYHRTYGVDGTAVRTGFPYGPGQRMGEYFVPRAIRGDAVLEPVGGDHPWDVTYVEDLACGIYLAHSVRPIEHRVFNITGGVLSTRGEFAETVARLIPGAAIHLGPGLQPERHLRGPCDLRRARRELGYEPRFDVESGVRRWIEWYRTAGLDIRQGMEQRLAQTEGDGPLTPTTPVSPGSGAAPA